MKVGFRPHLLDLLQCDQVEHHPQISFDYHVLQSNHLIFFDGQVDVEQVDRNQHISRLTLCESILKKIQVLLLKTRYAYDLSEYPKKMSQSSMSQISLNPLFYSREFSIFNQVPRSKQCLVFFL